MSTAVESQVTQKEQNGMGGSNLYISSTSLTHWIANVPVPAAVPQTPVMSTQIVPAPTPTKKIRTVAHKNVQWSGGPPEAIVTPPRPGHETTTRDKPEKPSALKTIAELQDEGQGTWGGT